MHATALIQGKDRKGIIATITGWIYSNNGNIIYLDQHTDQHEGMFFMRVQFDLEGFRISRAELPAALASVCAELGQKSQVFFSDERKKIAVMVSRQGHCLSDILYRWKEGEIDADVRLVVSNHTNLKEVAAFYGLPFYHFPVNRENKQEMEKKILELFAEYEIDTVILARYMQILTPLFVNRYPNAIINIHHSFLPAFPGSDPYRRAFERGVKLIGATSHYVTEELDEGPIIAQDVVRVSHRDTVAELKRKGKDVEKLVLARAVKLHVENRIIIHNGKTIVFGD